MLDHATERSVMEDQYVSIPTMCDIYERVL